MYYTLLAKLQFAVVQKTFPHKKPVEFIFLKHLALSFLDPKIERFLIQRQYSITYAALDGMIFLDISDISKLKRRLKVPFFCV